MSSSVVAKPFPPGRTFYVEKEGGRSWVIDGGVLDVSERPIVSLMLCATFEGS